MRLKPLALMLLVPALSGAHEITMLESDPNDRTFHFDPRIEITAKVEPASASTGATGTLQALVPITQSGDASDLWFAHAQAHYRGSTETQYLEASLGFGAGYRMQLDPELQIGAYGLLDLRLGATKEKYYLFTPGIEMQTSLWSVSLNGYLPMGKSASSVESETKWGHELGIDTYHHFKGNKELDHLHQSYQKSETLPIGLDLNGSWQFNEQLSLSVGGYYMKYGKETRPGARIGVAYALTPNFQLTLQGQKDNQDTQLSLQFRTSLGSSAIETNRLMTSIQRPLVPMAVIEDKTPIDLGLGDQTVHPYIVFHKKNGTGSGTFESPKGTVLSQADVDQLPDGAAIYLTAGKYTLKEETRAVAPNASWKNWFSSSASSTSSNTPTPLILNNKSLMGRTADFKAPIEHPYSTANEEKLAFLTAPVILTGEASAAHPMRLESVRLDNTISIEKAAHAYIMNNPRIASKKLGIQLSESHDINIINNPDIYGSEGGMQLSESHNITIMNNGITSVTNLTAGLIISKSHDITIKNNPRISSNKFGIQLSESYGVNLMNNGIASTKVGIQLSDSHDSIIMNNNISSYGELIELSKSHDTTIEHNQGIYKIPSQNASTASAIQLDQVTHQSQVQHNTFTIEQISSTLSSNLHLLGISNASNDTNKIKHNAFKFNIDADAAHHSKVKIKTQEPDGQELTKNNPTHTDAQDNTFKAEWKN